MSKKFDVIALGELLIDFTENGVSGQGNPIFEANPGGAPCNVLAMLNKLGKKTSFLGVVGKDQFGRLLRDTITEAGIDASHLVMDEEVNTTLAFVHTFPDGDREFSFYRNPGADMMLTAEEVDPEFIGQTKIFHFGTLSMTHDGVREATKKALKAAKENGCLISFDPNLRPPLWSSLDLAKEQSNDNPVFYVQYAHARIQSILRKANFTPSVNDVYKLDDAESWEIIKLIQDFPRIIKRAADNFEPSIIAKFAISLAQSFNKYYAHTRILDESPERDSRLALSYATATVLKEALRLLGVEAPDEM